MQTKSLNIEVLGILSELAYDNRYFLSIGRDTLIDKSDDDRFHSNYTVLETSSDFNYDSGLQAMLLENNNPQEGESRYVIAFRGTEPDQGFLEAYKDLIVADLLNMGTGRDPQQMKDTMDCFVQQM